MIPPEQSSEFVAAMEAVLDVYKRPYDPDYPVVCMDVSPKQLIDQLRPEIQMQPGQSKRVDYEYVRKGVVNIFMATEPLAGYRVVKITDTKKKPDWARFCQELVDQHYENAVKITLVLDNLNTHKAASFYETFAPEEAKRILDRFEFVFTPKHGSWLNMAEIELQVLYNQCLNRHINSTELIASEVQAWTNYRNNGNSRIDWQFTEEDARMKLKRLYPSIHV